MLNFDTLYLQNRHERDLQFSVESRLSVAAPTQRRNRSIPHPIKLRRAEVLDLCKTLSISKDEAKRVVESSPELQRLVNSLGWVAVVDYEIEAIIALGEALESLGREKVFVEDVRPPEVIVASAPLPEVRTPVNAEVEVDALAALPSGAITAIVEVELPRTSWKHERLLKYALDRGLKVSADMSKNALLKKIRDAL